jgi:hypothetical protein
MSPLCSAGVAPGISHPLCAGVSMHKPCGNHPSPLFDGKACLIFKRCLAALTSESIMCICVARCRARGPGLVIPYEQLLAYRELALSKYAPLDALIDERQICAVVEDVLQMPAQVGLDKAQICMSLDRSNAVPSAAAAQTGPVLRSTVAMCEVASYGLLMLPWHGCPSTFSSLNSVLFWHAFCRSCICGASAASMHILAPHTCGWQCR